MNRDQKVAFVEDIRGRLADAPLVILTDFIGSTVAEMDAVRRTSEEAGLSFQVVKNTLARRAVVGTEMEPMQERFRGNVGVLFSGEDPGSAAKLYKKLAKDNNHLICKGGFFEGSVLDDTEVSALADLPSREELLATMLMTVLAAPRSVMGVIQGPARDLVYLLKNYENKLADGA